MADDPRKTTPPWPRVATVAAAGALPFLAAAAVLTFRNRSGFSVGGDDGLLALSVRRAIHFRQLFGPYSRYGWHHPGPMYFYLLAPVAAVVSVDASLFVGMALLQAACAGVISGLTARRAGLQAGVVAAGAVAAVYALTGHATFLTDGWNPFAVVLPMAGLAVAAAAVCAGVRWAAVAAVLFASIAVQTHVSTAPPALGVLAAAALASTVLAVRRFGAAGASRRGAAPLAAAATTGLVAWSPALYDWVRHHPNNFGLMWQFFFTIHHDHHRLHESVVAVAAMLRPWKVWALLQASAFPTAHATLTVTGFAVACGVAAGIGMAARHTFAAALGLATLLMLALGLVSTTRVVGPIYGYLLVWMMLLPATLVISLVASGLALAPAQGRRAASAAVGAISIVAIGGLSWSAVRVPSLASQRNPAVQALTAAVEPQLPADHDAPVVVGIRTYSAWIPVSGLIDQLIAGGRHPTVQEYWISRFNEDLRRTNRAEAAEIDVWLARDPQAPADGQRVGDLVVTVGPVGPGAEALPDPP